MSLIVAENITHAFAATVILKNVSLRVNQSDRIGLVGANGQGKTTLLRIIAGQLEPDSGAVHCRRGLRIGLLPQDPPALEGDTVYGIMKDVFAGLDLLEEQMHDLAAQLAQHPDDAELLRRYAAVQAAFDTKGGYQSEVRIEKVLTGLAFGREMWDRPLKQLSGGELTRAYLAALLLESPDVLMLDEPTNHLDLDCIEWLEGFLRSFGGALIVVSHDRYFLDRVTRSTWEISFASLQRYRGSYSQYLTKRAERYKRRMRLRRDQQEHIRKTEEFIRIHLAGQRTKEAQGRRTLLERFLRDEAIPKPIEHKTIHLLLKAGKRTGDIALRARNLKVGYEAGEPLVKADELEVKRGERIAVVGANGIGKTTLLRTLMGDLAPLAGSVRLGANVEIGYLSQTHAELDTRASSVSAVLAASRGWKSQKVRTLLGSLLISDTDALKPIGELSGGQRSRVVLARLVVAGAGLLMLDEPSNHLDGPSTDILREALRDYDGAVVFVSHDRYLIQSVATHIWAVDAGEIRCILGGWDEYLKWRDKCRSHFEEASKANQSAPTAKADYKQARKKANLMQRLERRHVEIEGRIDTVENELAELNDAISAAGEAGDVHLVNKISKEYPQKKALLEQLWLEWEEIGEQLP
ncbi:MAG: ABC-F family ATP-binding cassette domain-containing protein [Planctomycetes bacterium]|nr:ABC-F family ATP-binding cassette domain-containing protein [Planctomycetota bacterium]